MPILDSPGALYARIENDTDHPDTLVAISTDAARLVEVHASVASGSPGTATAGMMSMVRVDRVAVPAHSTLSFVPGGYHGMLFGVRAGLKVGDSITVAFRFARAGPVWGKAAVIRYADVDTATAARP